ncbi:hypothetical protein F4604DRAFT_1933119 [Suillus subluteus]|nr:hypothetical protein F4604DRAFT_1933119 [Suillus subluteus]
MPRGRPTKKQKNISGLQGQCRQPSSPLEASSMMGASNRESRSHSSDDSGSSLDANEDTVSVMFDGLKINFEQEYMEDEDRSDIDQELEMDALDDEDFGCHLVEMPATVTGRMAEVQRVPSLSAIIEPSGPSLAASTSTIPCTRSASVISDFSSESSLDLASCSSDLNAAEFEEKSMDDKESEEWEEELDAAITGHNKIRDWKVLRNQIKENLKKHHKSLPLSSVNQLMILSNFATLQLKGATRIGASVEIARQWHEGSGIWFARRVRALAHHYQIFEELPREKRGGSTNARSFLHDETVQHGLQSQIFPELGIIPKQPIRVYMDGHEQEDVVKYRQEVYLPAMAKFEKRMVHFEGPELMRVEPTLQPGERQIKPYYHDECCFHANDETKDAWLRPGEQLLRKKGRGRLIHVSDFVNEEDGRLVLQGPDGEIIKDA